LAVLELSMRHLALVRDHAGQAYPAECCGLLLGRPRADGGRVTEVVAAENHDQEPRRGYDVDPGALLAGHRRARERGEVVIGYYHSHPDAPPRPSRRDVAAALPDASYLIVRVDAGQPGEVRSFRAAASGAGMVEERVEVVPP
jgi:proteasome lid subunit RPN8/RPN11